MVKNAHIDGTNEQKLEHNKRSHTVWGFIHGQNEVGILEGVDFLLRLVFFFLFILFLLFLCNFFVGNEFVRFFFCLLRVIRLGFEAIRKELIVAVDCITHFLDIIFLVRVLVLVVVDNPHLFLSDVVKSKTALSTERKFQVMELVSLHIHEVELILHPIFLDLA